MSWLKRHRDFPHAHEKIFCNDGSAEADCRKVCDQRDTTSITFSTIRARQTLTRSGTPRMREIFPGRVQVLRSGMTQSPVRLIGRSEFHHRAVAELRCAAQT